MSTRFAALIARFPTGELASAAGVSPTTVSQWKSATHLPYASKYAKIADACKMTVNEIADAITQDHVERVQARREVKRKPQNLLSRES